MTPNVVDSLTQILQRISAHGNNTAGWTACDEKVETVTRSQDTPQALRHVPLGFPLA